MSRACSRRRVLYRQCRRFLSPAAQNFWDEREQEIEDGLGNAGKFERYLGLLRRFVFPLLHSRLEFTELLQPKSPDERQRFYEQRWNTYRWRFLMRIFLSRTVMSRLGRDTRHFRYADESISRHLLERARWALVELDPAINPYLHWILNGRHGTSLPLWLQEDSFSAIRNHLDKIEVRHQSLDSFLRELPDRHVNRFNLSDVFEYMSETETAAVFSEIARSAQDGARILYWNMLVPRESPESLRYAFRRADAEALALHRLDRAFFYRSLRIEKAACEAGEYHDI